jgi:orotidine-5'-phosphate decarboxylase
MLHNPVYCAIDVSDLDQAQQLVRDVHPHVGGFKIGMEFFYRFGETGYNAIAAAGLPIFLDLKLNDIPNTVASGLLALAPLQPAIINIHVSAGVQAMRKSVEAMQSLGDTHPMLIGVSVLTSLGESDLATLGVFASPKDHVVRLAKLAQDCGLDGLVCSALEIDAIREACGPEFKLIVPGIRPADAALDDQKRVLTPSQAMGKGADILVIGRPITKADNPALAAQAIARELGIEGGV